MAACEKTAPAASMAAAGIKYFVFILSFSGPGRRPRWSGTCPRASFSAASGRGRQSSWVKAGCTGAAASRRSVFPALRRDVRTERAVAGSGCVGLQGGSREGARGRASAKSRRALFSACQLGGSVCAPRLPWGREKGARRFCGFGEPAIRRAAT
jgi:hypothetical protein